MQGDGPTTESTDIAQAVATGSPEQIDDAVGQLIARMRRGGDAKEVLAACALLQSERRFAALVKLSDSAARIAKPDDVWQLWPYVLTGLTELDAMLTAERLVKSLLAEPESAVKRGEFLARLGRIKKDQFVDSGDPAALEESIHAYVDAHATGNDPLWTGVNAIALRALAARRKLPPDGGAPISLDDLLTLAATAPSPRGAWSITTELELRVARGEKAADLQPLLTQLFAAPDATGFVFASFARQLAEIWEIDAADPLMAMLGEKTLATGQGEVKLPTTAADYESLFGAETPIGIENYLKGAGSACAVGALLHPSRGLRGTVFAVEGTALHSSLAGRVVLIMRTGTSWCFNSATISCILMMCSPYTSNTESKFVTRKISRTRLLKLISLSSQPAAFAVAQVGVQLRRIPGHRRRIGGRQWRCVPAVDHRAGVARVGARLLGP